LFLKIQKGLELQNSNEIDVFRYLGETGYSLNDNRFVRIPENSNDEGILPLSGFVTFRKYRISEILIEFCVSEMKPYQLVHNPYLLQLSQDITHHQDIKIAQIKLSGSNEVTAVLYVDGNEEARLICY
jgi:hypothetical protein